MEIPDLMQFQMEPFNGDKFVQLEFAKLSHSYPDAVAIETGTCLGSSTLYLAKHFRIVYTIEFVQEYMDIAKKRALEAEIDNIVFIKGSSAEQLPSLLFSHAFEKPVVFFLDAHWENHCPLETELMAIAVSGIKVPIIVIHDWKVPNESGLGYDSYNGIDFETSWISALLDKIYPTGWTAKYNTEQNSMGARRGVIYLSPSSAPM